MNFRPSEADRGCSNREGAVEVEVVERLRGSETKWVLSLEPAAEAVTEDDRTAKRLARVAGEAEEKRRSDWWLVLVRKRAPVPLSRSCLVTQVGSSTHPSSARRVRAELTRGG